MDRIINRKFPKITFDTFGFAFTHNCMIRIWVDDRTFYGPDSEVFVNYLIRVHLVKGGKTIGLVVTYIDAYHTDELFNEYLAMQINEAMKQLDESLQEDG